LVRVRMMTANWTMMMMRAMTNNQQQQQQEQKVRRGGGVGGVYSMWAGILTAPPADVRVSWGGLLLLLQAVSKGKL
jgi:hypothetical protein